MIEISLVVYYYLLAMATIGGACGGALIGSWLAKRHQ